MVGDWFYKLKPYNSEKQQLRIFLKNHHEEGKTKKNEIELKGTVFNMSPNR